jgi:hypothetical protein
MTEYLIVAIILVGALSYAAWRIYQAFRTAGNPCYGCSGCPLNRAQRRAKIKKQGCKEKK